MAAPTATALATPVTSTANTTTIALTSTAAAPANQTIVALEANGDSRTLSSFGDTVNTYAEATDAAGASIAHCLDPAVRGIGSVFTATVAANSSRKVLGVYSLSDKCTNEGAASATGSGSPTATTGSVPADCIVFGIAFTEQQDGSWTLPTDWNLLADVPIAANRHAVIAYFNTTGAGAVTFNPSYSGGSANWTVALSAYKKVASANPSIAADAGAYAVTGSAATLKIARNLAAAAESYVVSGAVAALRVSRKVAALGGSYAHTGADAALRLARKLAAEAGSYAVVGSDAALVKASEKAISADAGVYAVAGADAGLRRTRRLDAEGGSYAHTGSAAALKIQRRLLATAGGYNHTGIDADLIYSAAPPGPGNNHDWLITARRRGSR